jgi:hypothetical protein
MEILLFLLLALAVMGLSEAPVGRPGVVGLLVGLGVWIRPDAITLAIVPATSIFLLAGPTRREKWTDFARFAAGMAATFLPYLLFNLRTAGSLWPSTFYAKQAEYAVLRTEPLLRRLVRLAVDPRTGGPMTGAGIVLLPGVLLATVIAVRRRQWPSLGPLLWVVIYLGLSPLASQSRISTAATDSVLPVMVVMGWQGIYMATTAVRSRPGRILVRAWAASVVVITIGFVLLGARAYGQDVALIETEMVDTARWISKNTDEGALVAAHDIGALGYFGGREVLDLAGLAEAGSDPHLAR